MLLVFLPLFEIESRCISQSLVASTACAFQPDTPAKHGPACSAVPCARALPFYPCHTVPPAIAGQANHFYQEMREQIPTMLSEFSKFETKAKLLKSVAGSAPDVAPVKKRWDAFQDKLEGASLCRRPRHQRVRQREPEPPPPPPPIPPPLPSSKAGKGVAGHDGAGRREGLEGRASDDCAKGEGMRAQDTGKDME